MNRQEKLEALAELITKEQHERLIKDGLSVQVNMDNSTARIKEGKKYTKIDIGYSGKYMIDKDGNIFGVKAYGVIHRGHYYGTLDTINDYYWGNYTAYKKQPQNIKG